MEDPWNMFVSRTSAKDKLEIIGFLLGQSLGKRERAKNTSEESLTFFFWN